MCDNLKHIESIHSIDIDDDISFEDDTDISTDYQVDNLHFTTLQIIHPLIFNSSNQLFIDKLTSIFNKPGSLQLIEDCTGGTYKCYDKYHNPYGIFKPSDEEPYTDHNPKGYNSNKSFLDNSLIQCIPPGNNFIREYIAYQLYSNIVPHTIIIELQFDNQIETKIGSLQEYIKYDDTAENYSSTKFSTIDIHRIGILDLQLLNLDRHENNMLCQIEDLNFQNNSKSYPDLTQINPSKLLLTRTTHSSSSPNLNQKNIHLVPIDHGYSIPNLDNFNYIPNFCWYNWSQSHIQFSNNLKENILGININDEIELLKNELDELLDERMILTLKVTTLWLQNAVKNDFTLHEIAEIYVEESFTEILKTVKNIVGDLYYNSDLTIRIFDEEFQKYIYSHHKTNN